MRGDDPWAAISDPWQQAADAAPANATEDNPYYQQGGLRRDDYAVQPDSKAPTTAQAPDGYDTVFAGESQDPYKTGFHLSPEQQSQIAAAIQSGDEGLALRLNEQFFHGTGIRFDPEQIRAAVAQIRQHPGAQFGGFSYGPTDQQADKGANWDKYRGFDQKPMDELRANDLLPETADAFARGGALGADPWIDGVVSSVLHGGSVEDNVARAKAIRDFDSQNHPAARLMGGVAASMLLPTKVGLFAREAATSARAEAAAAGLSEAEQASVAQAAARQAMARQLLREGVGYGAAEGAIATDGGVGDRLKGALGGAALGGVTAKVLPKVGDVLSRSHQANLPEGFDPNALTHAQDMMAAADRQGIDLLPADVGGPMTRRATSMTAQTIVGGQPIIKAAERMTDQAASARDRIAATFGEALDREAAGQQAIQGAKAYRNSSRDEARAFYGPAESAAKGFLVTPTKALATLDENIADLSATPGGADALKTLQDIRSDLASGKTSVSGIRAMRTTLRDKFAQDQLRGSDIERRVNQVVDAASEDVTDSLAAAGLGDAAKLFAKGDAAWRARADTIDNVFEPIIGTRKNPRSGEQVIKTLTADLQGNNARAVKFLRALPESEQGNVRASIIGALGRSQAGQRSAEGEGFSLPIFLKNWNEIGENAKAAYFGPEARAALNDLAKVAKGAVEAQGYANRSNTGGAVGNVLTLMTGLGGVTTFGKTIAAQYGMGRLLASPRFARWLARMPRTQLSVPAYVDRLSRIARAEPAIANDILALQTRLTNTFGGGAGSVTRAAADEPLNNASGVGEAPQDQEYDNISEPTP